jgi:hypothetical protein
MCDFGFWEYATYNVMGFSTFQQTLQLPSPGSMTWVSFSVLGKLLLAFASTAILGSKFHGTHDHIYLS